LSTHQTVDIIEKEIKVSDNAMARAGRARHAGRRIGHGWQAPNALPNGIRKFHVQEIPIQRAGNAQ